MKKEIVVESVVLIPAEVRATFPSAMLASTNRQIVHLAQINGQMVKVNYFDAIWGRTVLSMEVAQ